MSAFPETTAALKRLSVSWHGLIEAVIASQSIRRRGALIRRAGRHYAEYKRLMKQAFSSGGPT